MADGRIDLPQGTLDLLILRTLALEALHGWAISERIHQISSKVLFVQQGSLYPALHRLERKGWIKARWGASENNRRAKFYELTASGENNWSWKKAPGANLPPPLRKSWRQPRRGPCGMTCHCACVPSSAGKTWRLNLTTNYASTWRIKSPSSSNLAWRQQKPSAARGWNSVEWNSSKKNIAMPAA